MSNEQRTPGASSGRRHRRLWIGAIGGVLAIVLLLGYCAPTARPPARVEDPVTVYVVTAALHKGLVLPDGPDHWVEYGFGDWSWYAERHDSWYRVLPVVLLPTRGTLGRRRYRATTVEEIRRRSLCSDVVPLQVEADRVRALAEVLDRRFSVAPGELHYDSRYRMHFAPAEDYWFPHNCHDAAAEWLDVLGCDVTWVPVRLRLEVRETPPG